MTADQARALGDWVAAKGRNLTDIFITHGHGDHWFAAGLLAERFGARVVATRGHDRADAAQRRRAAAALGQGVHGDPAVAGHRGDGAGQPLHARGTRARDRRGRRTPTATTPRVLHVPDLELVVAGDVIYNGVHMYLAQSAVVGGFGPWRDAIDKVEALKPRHIVAGHQNKQLDDDAERHDRRDPAVPRRRRGAPADRDHRDRLLQRQDRALPEPSRADGPVGGCQRALRRPRAPRRRHRARSFSRSWL